MLRPSRKTRQPATLFAISLVTATLASLLGAASAPADPAPATPHYRALAGVGGATTSDVMDALGEAITLNGEKMIASFDARTPAVSSTIMTKDPSSTPGGCRMDRPANDVEGQWALSNSIGSEDGCLGFARLSGEPHTLSTSPIRDVSYVPYAVDGITIARQRQAFNDSRGWSLAAWKSIYTCQLPTAHPKLPAAGSQLRSNWLSILGISESAVASGQYPCIGDTYNGLPIEENDTTVLKDDRHAYLPVSVASYLARPDRQQVADLLRITGAPEGDGGWPVVPNQAAFPDGLTWTTSMANIYDGAPVNLTRLQDIYRCRKTTLLYKTVTPYLPTQGTQRAAWLAKMGITEGDIAAGSYPCIRSVKPDGTAIQENDGRGLGTDAILPYSISKYLEQQAGTNDVRGSLSLGSIIRGTVSSPIVDRPTVLNVNYGENVTHRVYNVVPADKLRASPWREVFAGNNSLICQRPDIIRNYGFTPMSPATCGAGDLPLLSETPPEALSTVQTMSASAAAEWKQVSFPKRILGISHGRCRAWVWWSYSTPTWSKPGPIGGMFLDVMGFVEGPGCDVDVDFHTINYQYRKEIVFSGGHYHDDDKPSGPGKNEKHFQIGWYLGGNYHGKMGNVPYRVDFQLSDLTADIGASVGQIWGPTPNWCTGWSGAPGCVA